MSIVPGGISDENVAVLSAEGEEGIMHAWGGRKSRSGAVLMVLLDTEALPLGDLEVGSLDEVPMTNGLCTLSLTAISKAILVV
ncbi:MAG: hypothetical protein FJ211_11050 [Ignavibacteria bacterium]|nr:hypothetical protein [Ignavibacteria bacterium]